MAVRFPLPLVFKWAAEQQSGPRRPHATAADAAACCSRCCCCCIVCWNTRWSTHTTHTLAATLHSDLIYISAIPAVTTVLIAIALTAMLLDIIANFVDISTVKMISPLSSRAPVEASRCSAASEAGQNKWISIGCGDPGQIRPHRRRNGGVISMRSDSDPHEHTRRSRPNLNAAHA